MYTKVFNFGIMFWDLMTYFISDTITKFYSPNYQCKKNERV